MADDISVVVKVVGNKEIVSTTNNLKKMETGVKKLAQDLTKGRITGEQYNKGLKELRQTVDKSFSSWQQAKSAVDRYSKELKALTETQKQAKAAAQAEAAATKAYAQARREATEANRRFDAEAKKAVATARQQALANRKLRMEYREGYAAKVQLRLEQMRLSAAMRKGIIDTDQYKLAMDRLGQTAGRSGRSMNRTGVIVQQSGYQVGDFLVQVQSGTNAMVAFGQQATQVAGTLTILGGKWVAIGTALGITIPLVTAVGAYFMRTAKSADETSKSVENLEDSLKSLDSALQDWVRTKKAASMGLTVDELLGTESLEDATENLREARLELERISTAAALAGKGAAGGIDVFSLLGMGEQAQFDAAIQKVIDAENRLATLRQRDSDKRLSNFQEEYQAQMDNLDLQRTIAQFGSDSRQTKALELQQEIESYNRQIDLQVEQNKLTVAQGVALKKVFEESATVAANISDNFGKVTWEIKESVSQAIQLRDVMNQVASAGLTTSDRATVLRAQIAAARGGRSTVAAGATAETAIELARAGASADQIARIAQEAGVAAEEVATLEKTLSDLINPKKESSTRTKPAEDIENLLDILIDANKKFVKAREASEAFADSLAAPFSDGFTSIVDGTKSVEDAFREMARNVVKQLWDVYVMQQIIGSAKAGTGIAGTIASVFQADGGAWNKGVQMFANGGVVNSPTMFGHSGGVGMMGEAGPEAIMPLKRGANGKLGVQMEGGGGTVNQTINISLSANGDDSVKKIVAQAVPQITEAAKKAVINDRRRGGSMKAAFG